MGFPSDIVRSWRHPQHIMASHLKRPKREDRVFMYLMLACLVIFVSQWPGLARDARVDPSTPLEMRLGGALFAWIFVVPLMAYFLAAASRIIFGLIGGQGSWYAARLALFWALFSASPFWLLNGIVAGYGQPVIWQPVVGVLALAAFVGIWLSSLIQAEFGGEVY